MRLDEALDLLKEDIYNSEIDVNDTDLLDKALDILTDDSYKNTDEVVDGTVDSIEDIKPVNDYIGKVILDCRCCHSLHYVNPEDIEIDDETGVVRDGDCCPICYADDGYDIVGMVSDFTKDEPAEEVSEPEIEADDNVSIEPIEAPVDVILDSPVDESCENTKEDEELEETLVVEDNFENPIPRVLHSFDAFRNALLNNDFQTIKIKLKDCWNEIEDMGVKDEFGEIKSAKKFIDELQDKNDVLHELRKDYSMALKDLIDFCKENDIKLSESESLQESIQEINFVTDTDEIKVEVEEKKDDEPATDETVEVKEPEAPVEDKPVVAPLDKDTEDKIKANNDIEIDEIDENAFDDVVESVLEKNSHFITESIKRNHNGILIEGLRAKDDKKTKSRFIIESIKGGKVFAIANVKHFNESYSMLGRVKDKKFIPVKMTKVR